MSKQTLLTQGSKWVDLAQLGAAPATPAAGSNRLYVDANGLLQFTSPAGSQASRRVTTDWGVGTALPATGLGRGDIYTHSGIGCQFLWNGAQWRQTTRSLVTTEAQLAAIATSYGAVMHDGVEVFCSDTKATAIWDATNSVWHITDSVTQTYAPVWTAANSAPTLGSSTLVGRYRRMGRLCWVQILLDLGSGSNGGSGGYSFTLPAAAVTGREQAVNCWAYTALGSISGIGFTFGGGTISPWLPTSFTSSGMSTAATTTNGAVGTGVPAVSGQYTFAVGHNIRIEGTYEMNVG